MFNISKALSSIDLITLVATLNAQTRDGHIADQIKIGEDIWLVRIACSYRDDADRMRGL